MDKRRHWATSPALLIALAILPAARTLSYGLFFRGDAQSLPARSQACTAAGTDMGFNITPLWGLEQSDFPRSAPSLILNSLVSSPSAGQIS